MHTVKAFPRFLVIGLVLLLCASQAGTALSASLGAVQDLIDAASPGATVMIPAGTYNETLLINKTLTLRGASSATTILRPGAPEQRVIKVTAGNKLRLENLTVSGGNPTTPGDNGGGGVYLENGGLELVSCVISGNTASYGGGVFQQGASGSVTATDSLIQGNTATVHGGGLYVEGSATLTNTTLDGNIAAFHGGGLHVDKGNAALNGGIVSNNRANGGNGGGVNLNNGLSIIGTQFNNNTASDSGGAVTQWNADQTVTISDAAFYANTARNNGGGVFIQSSFLTIDSTGFAHNTVDSGGSGNTYGGGLYAGGGLDGSQLSFTDNLADCPGCGFTGGGGLYVQRPVAGTSTISHSAFEGNLAWIGSGVFSHTTVQLTLIDTSFIENGDPAKSGYGGGIYAYSVNGDQLLFQGNSVLNFGGGLDSTHDATLTRSRFIGNSSNGGGGVYVSGNFTGKNLLFAGNHSVNGAALRVASGAAVLWHATISQPVQGTGPAVRIETGVTMDLKNSIFTNYNPGITLAGTLNEDYNLFYNNTIDIILAGGTHNGGGHSTNTHDPLLADPAGGDYHLRYGSPAVGMGLDLGVTVDLDGIARQNRWDAGAYQFNAKMFLPVLRR